MAGFAFWLFSYPLHLRYNFQLKSTTVSDT